MPCTMGDLVLRCIEYGGDNAALVSGDERISYSRMGELLSRMIPALREQGIRRGTGFACLSSNRFEAFLLMAAAYLMGARITNLHPLGSAEDHRYIIENSEAEVLVFDPEFHGERVRKILSLSGDKVKVVALGESDIAPDLLADMRGRPPAGLKSEAAPDDICFIVYTGGTTGRPKGVVHTHETHLALTMAKLAEWEFADRPRFLVTTPISHGAGLCILPALLKGGTVHFSKGFDAAGFVDTVNRHRIDSTFMVPTMIYKLLDHLRVTGRRCETLSCVVYGAAPMSPARMTEALDLMGPVFMQLYGQSEAPNCVTVLRKADHDPVNHPGRIASCGRPIHLSQVRLLNDDGVPVAPGEVGEICVRGPLVMTGYWKNESETRKAIRDGWLRTGDLARKDADGFLYIVGRSKDLIISGGFNVYPAEVEDTLTAHPAVSAAAVIGVPHPQWGEAVHAVVVLRPGHMATAEELCACVRQAKGPVYAPKTLEFRDGLPLTALGKPDKKALRNEHIESR